MVDRVTETTVFASSGIAPRLGGVYTCECCPKKPKEFHNEEEVNYV